MAVLYTLSTFGYQSKLAQETNLMKLTKGIFVGIYGICLFHKLAWAVLPKFRLGL